MKKIKAILQVLIIFAALSAVSLLTAPAHGAAAFNVVGSAGGPPSEILGTYVENGTLNEKPCYSNTKNNNFWIYYGECDGVYYWFIGYNKICNYNGSTSVYYYENSTSTPPTNVNFTPGQTPGAAGGTSVKIQTAVVLSGISEDTGASGSDGVTNDQTLVIKGSSEGGATVEVFKDGVSIGVTTANGSGAWSYDYTGTTLPAGTYSFTAGDSSLNGSPFSVTIDITPPAKPTITSIKDDTGISSSDGITKDNTLTVSGTADPLTYIDLFDSLVIYGTAQADASGNWSISGSFPPGSLMLSAKSSDLAGNYTNLDSFAIKIDFISPTTTVSSCTLSVDTGAYNNDFVTKTASQTISGTLSANLATDEYVQVSLDNGSTWATATASGSAWSFDATLSGSNTLLVKVTDLAGNDGALYSRAYMLDTAAPSAPSAPDMTAASDSGTSNTDNVTSNTTPTFTGTAESGTTVKLYAGATEIGIGTAAGGSWSITSSVLSEGSYVITAKAIDLAGNEGPASAGLSIEIDTTKPSAPSAPDMTSGTDFGVSNTDNITSDTTPTFTGTAEPNCTVMLYNGATEIGSGTADGSGNWSLTSSVLAAGSHTITAKASDAAGNLSDASAGLAITIDTTAPTVSLIMRQDPMNYLTNAASVVFRVTFSESVTGLRTSDFKLSTTGTADGTISKVSPAIGSSYDVTVNAISGIGSLRLDLNTSGTGIADTAGNAIAEGFTSGETYSIDKLPPTVSSIVRQTPSYEATNLTSVTFRVTFYESVTGVDESDFTLTKTGTAVGTVASVSSISGSIYDVTVNTISGDGTLRLDLNDSGTGIIDTAGNAIAEGFTSGETYTIDNSLPTVSSIMRQIPMNYLTSAESVVFCVTFSERVAGVDISDFTLTTTGTAAGTIASVSVVSGSTFTVAVSSISGNGTLRLDLKESGTNIVDFVGNVIAVGFTSGETYTIDRVSPAVTSVTVPEGTYKMGQDLYITVNYDENVAVDTSGGRPRIAITIGSKTVYADYFSLNEKALLFRYTIASGDVDSDGIIIGALQANGGTIQDAVGNNATLNLSNIGDTSKVLADGIAPTVTSVTAPSDGRYKSGDSLYFTVNFSEDVTVDTVGGTPRITLAVGLSTKYAAYQSSSSSATALVFTYTVEPGDYDSNGIAIGPLGLNGGTIKDAAGNDAELTLRSIGSTAFVLVDTIAPTVSSIVRQTPSYEATNLTSVTFRVTFSESVTGVDESDFTLTKTGTAVGTVASVSSISGSIYDVTVNTISGDGTLRLDLNDSGTEIRDDAGNAISAGYTSDEFYTIDNAAPSVTITSTASNMTNTSPIPLTITFSKSVTGFEADDILVTGGSKGTLTGSGSSYSIDITPTGEGTVTVDIAADAAKDSAGNGNTAATQASWTYDVTAPTAPSVSSALATTTDSTPTWTWTAGGGGNGNFRYKLDNDTMTSGATETTDTSYTPSSPLGEGSHTLYVQERDDAGNWSSSGSFTLLIDIVAPLVTTADPVTDSDNATIVTLGGEVINDGGAEVTDRGIVISESDNTPTIGESGVTKLQIGTGTGSFSSTYSVSPSTTYYACAYAANPEGTSYGSVSTFTTLSGVPTITSLSASAGSYLGGTSVTITGTNFVGVSEVSFGSSFATYTVSSSTQLIAIAPAGDPGPVNVKVKTIYGESNAKDFTYTINAPTVTAISPDFGPVAGGTGVTISGTYFVSVSAVYFGLSPASYSVDSPTQITATAPEGTGTVDVTVETAGGTSSMSSASRFTYIYPEPSLIAISPNSGPKAGGTSVNISGTYFINVSAVYFGITSAAFTVDSPTQITATAPAGTGEVNITISAAGGTSGIVPAGVFTYTSGGSGGGGGNNTNPNTGTGTEVIVNGESKTAGTTSTSTNSEGKTVTTVTVDTTKLESILGSTNKGATVTIPFTTNSDVVEGILTGEMVKSMESREATLIVKTGTASYTLPASEINIDSISQQFGPNVPLSEIKVSVQVSEPSASTVEVIEDAASKGNYQLVVPPVEFNVSCTYGGKTVSVSSFGAYVERMIAIPEGVDPSKITTAVVLNSDGTFSHVPTQIVVIDGKHYAKINSLTNSTYTVVWHPMEFKDAAKHWAKTDINDMGSRLVVNGDEKGDYNPDRNITRAEFATIIVRALGLRPAEGSAGFADVRAGDWFSGYIKTAFEYGIISGYDADTFGPNDTITREQAMTILARAMEITKLDSALKKDEVSELVLAYTDYESVSDYALDGVAACLKTGIVNGRGNNSIAPKDFITRAEVAVLVRRLLQKSGLI